MTTYHELAAADRERTLRTARDLNDAGGPRAAWFADALCPEIGPWLFTGNGENDDQGAFYLARLACQLCTVRVECLADALSTGERSGVRGGVPMATVTSIERGESTVEQAVSRMCDPLDEQRSA